MTKVCKVEWAQIASNGHNSMLVEDVGLEYIALHREGNSLELGFQSMVDGSPTGTLVAAGVYWLDWQNGFMSGDGLPAYVGEVSIEHHSLQHIKDKYPQLTWPIESDTSLAEIVIEGGEVSSRIICDSVELSGIVWQESRHR